MFSGTKEINLKKLRILQNIKQALEKEQKVKETKDKKYLIQTKEEKENNVLDTYYKNYKTSSSVSAKDLIEGNEIESSTFFWENTDRYFKETSVLKGLNSDNFVKNKQGEWVALKNGRYTKLTEDMFVGGNYQMELFKARLDRDQKIISLEKQGYVRPNINDLKYQGLEKEMLMILFHCLL